MGTLQISNPKERDYVKEFKEGYLQGTAGFIKAGKAYVAALDADPNNMNLFREALPGFTESVWRQYEELGRGMMYFGTITAGPHKSKIRKMSYSVQKQISDGQKYELLAGMDVLNVDPREITQCQANQLFANDHIRTISEQRAWLAENPIQNKEQEKPKPMPIMCRTGYVTITRPVRLSRKQVQEILMQI